MASEQATFSGPQPLMHDQPGLRIHSVGYCNGPPVGPLQYILTVALCLLIIPHRWLKRMPAASAAISMSL